MVAVITFKDDIDVWRKYSKLIEKLDKSNIVVREISFDNSFIKAVSYLTSVTYKSSIFCKLIKL
jgi:abortive infection bacteriophage resistance protein